MRKFIVLVSLLLLSILNDHQASGIRLTERSVSSAKQDQRNVHVEKNYLMRRSNDGMRAAENVIKEDHISETGSNRKLMTKTSVPSSSTSKNDKNDHEEGNNKEPTVLQKGNQSSRTTERSLPVGKEENFKVNSSTVLTDDHHQHPKPADGSTADHGHYPDILDIAGMDYSPAKRKPPIHN